jgi:hypothetical protein
LSDGRGLVISGLVGSATQIFQLSYPDGETSRITNDLNTYVGASLTADSRTLVTVEDALLSGIWIKPGDVRRARQLTTAADRTEGPTGRLTASSSTLPISMVIGTYGKLRPTAPVVNN